jgi:hypothetical protein
MSHVSAGRVWGHSPDMCGKDVMRAAAAACGVARMDMPGECPRT